MNSMETRTAESAVETLERESDDRPLIEAAQSEPARFAELYDHNFDRVYAFFARRVSSREEAQDLTAEVFHQALASIRTFKWQGAPFIAWLYGIAANVLSKHWRKQGKHVEQELTDLSGMGGSAGSGVGGSAGNAMGGAAGSDAGTVDGLGAGGMMNTEDRKSVV